MVSKPVDPAQRLAALGDLRKCLEIAEEIGEIEIIEGADPHLEMGVLYELSLQKAIPPILLFRKIKGIPELKTCRIALLSSRSDSSDPTRSRHPASVIDRISPVSPTNAISPS